MFASFQTHFIAYYCHLWVVNIISHLGTPQKKKKSVSNPPPKKILRAFYTTVQLWLTLSSSTCSIVPESAPPVSPLACLQPRDPEVRPPSSPCFGTLGEMNSTSSTSNRCANSNFLSTPRGCCLCGNEIQIGEIFDIALNVSSTKSYRNGQRGKHLPKRWAQ